LATLTVDQQRAAPATAPLPDTAIDPRVVTAANPLIGLWRLMKGFRWVYLVATLTLGIGAMAKTGSFLLLQRLVDDVLAPGMQNGDDSSRVAQAVLLIALSFVGLALVEGLFTFLSGLYAAKTAEGITRRLRNYLFDHLQRMRFSFHDQHQTGDLIQRSTSDVMAIHRFYSEQAIGLGRIVLLFVINFAALLLLSAAALGAVVGGLFGARSEASLSAEVQASRAAVDTARAEAQRDLNAMAVRLGELQAQANRLNALGQRLTQMGQLKGGEFDFSERPAMGGPEADKTAPTDAGFVLGSVEASFAEAEKQLDLLGALLEGQQLADAARPSRAPAPGYISSGFGFRADPFTGARRHHYGVDFDANIGDPIQAAADGIVSFSGWKAGYGHTVVIDHGDGYQTLYAHNQKNVVRVGDVVRAGQQVAKVGSSGRSSGAHLHFEVHVNGRPVNPVAYLERLRR